MNQLQFIHKFIGKTYEKFNTNLFKRSDDKIIEQLEKIILSCQTEGLFTIKVNGFDVIDDYVQIHNILQNYYEEANKKGGRRKHKPDGATDKEEYAQVQNILQKRSEELDKKNGIVNTGNRKKKIDEDNRYNFIDLKNSDIRLLIIHYFIAIKDQTAECDVIIAVPRIVHKFYFYLNGNYYLPMYQIVDASTYNNSTSKSKKHRITLKTNFPPANIYRHTYKLTTVRDETVPIVEYDCNAFSKTVPTALFIFAKFGLIDGLHKLGLDNIFSFSDTDKYHDDETLYTFVPKRNHHIFIHVPKVICDKNCVVQHVVYTLCMDIDADLKSIDMDEEFTCKDLFNTEYWVSKLGSSFNSANRLVKGYNILKSIESILDINVQEQLHIPWRKKKDIYDLLIWMIQDYASIRQKDTLDVTKKKIRCSEYMAATYALKLNGNIYRLSNSGNRADIKSLKSIIYIQPMFLLNELTKSKLITFRNIVTDMDSLAALKFTYTGISGVGEKNGSIPQSFRLLDISNMGILDPDASSPSSPGVSGSLVPMLKPYEHGYLSDEPEPLTWDDEYGKLYEQYKQAKGLEEVVEFSYDFAKDDEAAKNVIIKKMSTAMIKNINTAVAENAVDDGEDVL